MKRKKNELVLSAIALVKVGEALEAAKVKLKGLVDQGLPYESDEIKTALNECMELQQQWRDLYHIVIHTDAEASLLGGDIITGSHKEDGDLLVQLSDISGEFKAIHTGHHNIRYDQIDHILIKGIVGIIGTQAADGLIAAMVQKEQTVLFSSRSSSTIKILNMALPPQIALIYYTV